MTNKCSSLTVAMTCPPRASQDQDQEVKECAIGCMAATVAVLGDVLGADVAQVGALGTHAFFFLKCLRWLLFFGGCFQGGLGRSGARPPDAGSVASS